MFEKTMEAVIPVYKPGAEFAELLKALDAQALPLKKIHLMRTRDGRKLTDLSFMTTPIEIHELDPIEFDHGGTRAWGFSLCESDYILCMTQDAVPEDGKLTAELLAAFDEPRCAVAYARQMARPEHGVNEAFTRRFNYPETDRDQNLQRLDELGIKTYFCSDACALYSRVLYEELGGFVQPCIFNEDSIMAYRFVQAGYTIRYRAMARVWHSHSYTGIEQFRRNFDLGISQAQHPEIFETVSSSAEGKRLVKDNALYLLKAGKFLQLICLIWQSGMKFLGYKFGKKYRKLPFSLVKRWSMNRYYWMRNEN